MMQHAGRTFHKIQPGQAFVEIPEHYQIEFVDGGYYLEYRKPVRDWPLLGMHALTIFCMMVGVIAIVFGTAAIVMGVA
ncbi:hypothetical protein [Neorhizobium galegae]|uniref:hypothetical protein n=1 Tax=Neorhizobium galegae TaxID=399 RepID=UPI000571007E|nr:hypothetical protein [Neorhizobium galegae]MCQ1855829.1 hypothetical protein [Neorhizobium galegae]